jgi:soluble lytic murein transglycosylase-like protein
VPRRALFHSTRVWRVIPASVNPSTASGRSSGPASRRHHHNANGSVDLGQLQINSIHFSDLARAGIPHRALMDPCVNVFVAAWLMKQKMVKYGNTWRAIGAYHSESPKQRDAYARSIQQILVSWGELRPTM